MLLEVQISFEESCEQNLLVLDVDVAFEGRGQRSLVLWARDHKNCGVLFLRYALQPFTARAFNDVWKRHGNFKARKFGTKIIIKLVPFISLGGGRTDFVAKTLKSDRSRDFCKDLRVDFKLNPHFFSDSSSLTMCIQGSGEKLLGKLLGTLFQDTF